MGTTVHRRRFIVPVLLLTAMLAGLLLRTSPEPDIHTQLQQRLIEAEFGSATSFHLAAGPRAAQPPSTTPLSEVLKQLTSSRPEQRWAAAGELSARRDPRAVEAVIRAMRDPQDTVRVCLMASTLGYLHDPRALGPLTEAAFDPGNRDLRLCAIESLGMLGDRRAVPDLIRALESRNMPVAAANAIAQLGDARGVAPLITAAADPTLSLWMISALGELGNAQALPYLNTRAAVLDDDATLRQATTEAIWKISRLNTPNPTLTLADSLARDQSVTHRAWAAFRLGERSGIGVVPALLAALDDTDRGVRERAAAALIRSGAVAREAMFTRAAQPGSGQVYAVAVLGYIGDPTDIARVQKIGRNGNAQLALVATHSAELIQAFTNRQSALTQRNPIEP